MELTEEHYKSAEKIFKNILKQKEEIDEEKAIL